MAGDKKFHQTPLGNIVCLLVGVGIAALVVFVIL